MKAKAIIGLDPETSGLTLFPLEGDNILKTGTYFVFIDKENKVHVNFKKYKPYKFDLKPMIYKKESICEVLVKGTYMDVKFAIISCGTHPCAYVEDIIGCSGYKDDKIEDIEVHGGFTYFGRVWTDEKKDKTKYLGWDYAHCGDYNPSSSNRYSIYGSKMWTTEEILEEVKYAIEQLKSICKKGIV